ncbi:MAG: pirin family protein [Peptostreptococcaceae bacterium]|nr:pirin family protein [Peptostreptococcaceae bacterium]
MDYRKIEMIFKNDNAHWVGNGFRVKQYFPAVHGADFFERFSPFLLMDYNEPFMFKGTNAEVGVGAHPHRGFETVTFAFEGEVEHGDNRGNCGVIRPGDIQWMTAGSGILHKEFHEREYAKKDRMFHMIQLWVNLPKAHKMTEPKYQSIRAEQMGKYQSDDGGVNITVYAGEVLGVKGPASTFSPMNIYKVDLKKGKSVTLTEPADFNSGMLILSGHIEVNAKDIVKDSDFVLFENDGKAIRLMGMDEESSIFVLSGQPLNEPVAAMGPFVMNTREELTQANTDFKEGKFGSFDF